MVKEQQTTEVVVVGAGPAGTTCAYQLRKAGIECLLLDQAEFPRDKICGGGLTTKAYTLLAKLMPDFKYDYQSIKKVKVKMGNTVFEFEPADELRIVSRKVFDYELLQQYLQAGGQFKQGSFARYDVQPDGRILVTLKSGQQILCNYLVGADGANSRVRNQMKGTTAKILCLEQYVEKSKDAVEIELSSEKFNKGYYYLFPGVDYDVVGFGDQHTTIEGFRQILAERGIKETKLRGAYIPVEEVVSDLDNIILIGDAGGFPNKVSYEGLYYAIATGMNAAKAISEGTPFSKVNHKIFKKKRREQTLANFFYSRLGLAVIKLLARYPKVIKLGFDKAISPDK